MHNSTFQAETCIPTETVVAINSRNLNRTFTVRRKAAKRSERWHQNTAAPLSLPARKKPRIEEPPSTDTVAASTLRQSSHHVNTTNSTTTPAPAPAAPTDAANASILPQGSRQDQLPPTESSEEQLDDDSGTVSGRKGKWTTDEDNKLTSAVETHVGESWYVIAALIPNRTKQQGYSRWYQNLDPSLDRANGRTGKWVEDEDIKLKSAVEKYGGKNWNAIATLVPDRTNIQCYKRWKFVLEPKIDQAIGCSATVS
jgi:hypothetical protein